MRRSEQRILTTHAGSLPRPDELLSMIMSAERGDPVDPERLALETSRAVREMVAKQVAAGVDVISDGEMSKPGYSTYVKDRLTGFHGEGHFPAVSDLAEFPALLHREVSRESLRILRTPACSGPIAYVGRSAVERDIANLKAAINGTPVTEAFLTAASPGVISLFLENQYYRTDEAYLYALAEAMRTEYEAICASGLLLQVDCPDLAMGRHIQYADLDLRGFRKKLGLHVEALDHALANVPAERVRMHVCWANYEGPHHHDVELRDIVDVVIEAKPAAISFVAANPRHEHEWSVWKDVKLPAGKVLIPGIIDTTTNFIEHPDLVAERIARFARIVGPENVIAGTDCGFSTFAGHTTVDPEVTWAKLGTLSEGARRATRLLMPARARPVVPAAARAQRS